MSNNYKKSMDKIILSDEFKNKIVHNMISQKANAGKKYKTEMNRLTISDIAKKKIIKTALGHKNQTTKRFRINSVAGTAACLILFIAVISAAQMIYLTPETNPENPDTALKTQTPTIPAQDAYGEPAAQKKAETYINAENQEKNININENPTAAKNPDHYININENETELEDKDNDNDMLSPADIPEVPTDSQTEHTPEIPPLTAENPFTDNEIYGCTNFDSAEDLINAVSYKLSEPEYLPAGYTLSDCSLISRELSEFQYTNGSDIIIYRAKPGSEDCSGNYNSYSSVKNITLKNITALLKTDPQKGFLALWNHDGMTYSLDGSELLTENDIIKIIKNII